MGELKRRERKKQSLAKLARFFVLIGGNTIVAIKLRKISSISTIPAAINEK